MSNKDNKRGFSGISNLTSDTGTLQQTESHPPINHLPSQKTVFELLHLSNWPSLPSPWSSSDAGETWIWGDFFLLFQKEPEMVATVFTKMNGGFPQKEALNYHYAMIVFYRLDRNPHGPSHQPIMAVGLEQCDMSMAGAIFGQEMVAKLQAEGITKMGPLMLGLFTAKNRTNLGRYAGDINPQAVKKKFFEILASLLPVTAQPKMIGSLADARGHPETGLPAPAITPASPGKSGRASLSVWSVFGFLLIIGVIIGAIISRGYNREPAYKPPSSSQRYSSSQSGAQTSSVPQRAELQYTKPSVGTDNVLSVLEIRWCIREDIRIEVMRDIVDTNAGINAFNRIVTDYNSRCGSYRYRQGALEQAKREVEPYRSQIVADAISEARAVSLPPPTSNTPEKPTTSSVPEKPHPLDVWEAQQLLTDLGYNPGPIDGDYGRRTANAVKAFQRDAGITQDGLVDEDLLSRLRRAKSFI